MITFSDLQKVINYTKVYGETWDSVILAAAILELRTKLKWKQILAVNQQF